MAKAKAAKQAPAQEHDGAKFHRPLVTPEGVDLGVRIASASERAGAFMIDAVIIFAILIALTFVAALAGVGRLGGGDFSGVEVAIIIWLIGSFLLRNFYFFLFEIGARGATPGKRLLRIRVATRNGGVLDASAIFARNAMREVEVFMPMSLLASNAQSVDAAIGLAGFIWCAIFVFFPMFNRDRLRAGDLIAGTWVVQSPRAALLPDLVQTRQKARATGGSMAPAMAFTREQLDVYGIKELQVLEDLLRRADHRGYDVVAQRIRKKIGWTATPGERDADFLSAYYAALRQHLETRLLVGVRKADKHSTR